MSAASTVRSTMELASSAAQSGDWSSAVSYAHGALALMSGLPDGTDADGRSMTWGRSQILELITLWERKSAESSAVAAGAGVFGQMKVQWHRPTGGDC